MTIRPIEKGSRRANLDAVSALRTIQPATERADDGIGAAIAGFNSLFAHPFIADARATLAEDATLRIVSHHGRKIFLGLGVLTLDEPLFQVAPIESQFLKLAFATAIAHGTIERMVREQKLEHRPLRLFDLFTLRSHHHAVGANNGAGRLQLWHFLDAHQTHATRSLQSQVGVITERGNRETV